MIRHLTVVVVVAALLVIAGCQHKHHHEHGNTSAAAASASASAPDSNAKQAVLDVMEQHRQGLLKKDIATLDRIWADDFVFINPNGQMFSKAQRLANVKTGSTSFKSLT